MARSVDPAKEQDRLREKVAAGLRAEQALPFIRPYLQMRLDELNRSLNYYAVNSDKDKVFEVSIRISEIQTIFDEIGRNIHVGRQSDVRLAAK